MWSARTAAVYHFQKNNCLRIKILGDCYYCVSGVPLPDARHARNCVHMGLDMIELIKDVRREHGVNVDMRIGVHTGFILSGIIGNKRWQYDIWSKDVTIANHMESAGVAGAVHITRQTKDHLGDAFRCQPVSELRDETLRSNNIEASSPLLTEGIGILHRQLRDPGSSPGWA